MTDSPKTSSEFGIEQMAEEVAIGVRRLSSYAIMVAGLTILHIIGLTILTAMSTLLWAGEGYSYIRPQLSAMTLILSGFVTATVAFSALIFDRRVKTLRAQVDFLVDRIQTAKASDLMRGNLQFEVIQFHVRKFNAESDLPLAPGQFGPLIYIVLNIAVFIGALQIVRL